MKVLIALRSRAVASAMHLFFEGRGVEAETAFDGVQALEALRHGAFDVLIADFDLPRVDGRRLVRCLLTRGEYIPTIGISDRSEVTAADLADSDGMDVVLPKPFSAAVLLSLAEALAREKNAEGAKMPFWQKKVLELIPEEGEVSFKELCKELEGGVGSPRTLIAAAAGALLKSGSNKRIALSGKGYRVITV